MSQEYFCEAVFLVLCSLSGYAMGLNCGGSYSVGLQQKRLNVWVISRLLPESWSAKGKSQYGLLIGLDFGYFLQALICRSHVLRHLDNSQPGLNILEFSNWNEFQVFLVRSYFVGLHVLSFMIFFLTVIGDYLSIPRSHFSFFVILV